MSLLPDPFKETDKIIDEIEAEAPATVANVLESALKVLAGQELVIRISLEKKP